MYFFIMYDLVVVWVLSDFVCVMEKGRIVEQGIVDEIFVNLQEEYIDCLFKVIFGVFILFGGC